MSPRANLALTAFSTLCIAVLLGVSVANAVHRRGAEWVPLATALFHTWSCSLTLSAFRLFVQAEIGREMERLRKGIAESAA